MRFRRALGALLLAIAASASATTIPEDLKARAAGLKRKAPPAVLAWVHEQAAPLAKASGPVNVGAIERSARTTWTVLGDIQNADIEAICFLVLMEAAKSAQEDLEAVMAAVKAANKAKEEQRKNLQAAQAAAAAAAARTPTPTPGLDRVAQLVAAARNVEPKTQGADLSKVVKR